MIAVSIVEDNADTLQSLATLLGNSPGITCVSTHRSCEEALREIGRYQPSVVLMDINLPGMSGIEGVRPIKALLPHANILMLTAYEDTDRIFSSLRAGATGYLLKSMPPDEIIAAIEQIVQGGSPMSASIARKLVTFFNKLPQPSPDLETLTVREREILGLLAKGLYYKEIGNRLFISAGTVRTHLHAIYGKLHVNSRTEAVVKFLESGDGGRAEQPTRR